MRNLSPFAASMMRPPLSRGPHSANSSTFSRMTTRGALSLSSGIQRSTSTIASSRRRTLRVGAPPLALE